MLLKELTNIPHNRDLLIVISDGGINITPETEVEIVHFTQVGDRHVFLGCNKYRAMFAGYMEMSFDEATDEQKLQGMYTILDKWDGVETATPKVSFRQSV